MSADLIKEKISQAVEKINSLKDDLKQQKNENEVMQNKITELHAANLELNDRIQRLEEEKRNLSENNDTTVREIEDRLAMLTELLDEESEIQNLSENQENNDVQSENNEQEHFF